MAEPRGGIGGAGQLPVEQRFYGRRKGRPLGKTLQRLLVETLPSFRFAPDVPLADQFVHDPGDVFLEIGFGGGEHLAGLALAKPDAGAVRQRRCNDAAPYKSAGFEKRSPVGR